jgi:non-canonical purine NTP pyrophosphatase (RdgB/HAM1 family)
VTRAAGGGGAAPALPPFTLVTGNAAKRAEAERILLAHGVEGVECHALDLPELQSLDLLAVLRAKGQAAWAALGRAEGRPVVVEETGLELAALAGFPGPLVRWMLEAVGAEGIARTALALGDPRAVARCALLWTDGASTVVGEGVAEGTLVMPARGARGFGWDPVFQPSGESRTYAELAAAEKDLVGHRGRAWRDLLAKLGA